MRLSKPLTTVLRPSWVNDTAPERSRKSRSLSSPLLNNVRTTEIGDDGAEFLGKIQGQRGSAVLGLVVKAQVRVEAHRQSRDEGLSHQHGVEERQHRVDRVSGRAPIPSAEIESCRVSIEQRAEVGKIHPGRRTLHAQQGGECVGGAGRGPAGVGFRQGRAWETPGDCAA